MCGQFLVPFWKFFLASLIGKALIKTHIQVNPLSQIWSGLCHKHSEVYKVVCCWYAHVLLWSSCILVGIRSGVVVCLRRLMLTLGGGRQCLLYLHAMHTFWKWLKQVWSGPYCMFLPLPTSRPASCLPWAMPRIALMEKWSLRYHNCTNSSYSSSFGWDHGLLVLLLLLQPKYRVLITVFLSGSLCPGASQLHSYGIQLFFSWWLAFWLQSLHQWHRVFWWRDKNRRWQHLWSCSATMRPKGAKIQKTFREVNWWTCPCEAIPY